MSSGREFQRTGAWKEKDLLVILRREILAGRSKVRSEKHRGASLVMIADD